jgi:uncharacterized BrkB/YihY/UPF0761 family membrane protein
VCPLTGHHQSYRTVGGKAIVIQYILTHTGSQSKSLFATRNSSTRKSGNSYRSHIQQQRLLSIFSSLFLFFSLLLTLAYNLFGVGATCLFSFFSIFSSLTSISLLCLIHAVFIFIISYCYSYDDKEYVNKFCDASDNNLLKREPCS